MTLSQALSNLVFGGMTPAHASGDVLRTTIRRYAVAIILPAVALWLSLALGISFNNPFWFFFPSAVIASTWFCGKIPGWLTTALSMVAVQYYFIPPLRSFAIRLEDVPFSLTCLGCQAFATWLVSRRKVAEDSLRQVNAALVDQIAERERAEESLRQSRSDLARAVRVTMVGELAASIAHEINQPLAAIATNADACIAWLGSESPNLPEAAAAAERTAAAATRASEVISRIRSLITNAPSERVGIHLNDVIREIVNLTAHQAATTEVSVSADLQPNLPTVLGDRVQFQQVLLNLITNGLEATSGVHGRPRTLTVRSRTLGTDQVQVFVSDSGIGVSPEVMPRLFEPFFTTRTQGIGMGLAISRSIIESHGGRLWAESSPGQGSTFQFTVPRSGSSRAEQYTESESWRSSTMTTICARRSPACCGRADGNIKRVAHLADCLPSCLPRAHRHAPSRNEQGTQAIGVACLHE